MAIEWGKIWRVARSKGLTAAAYLLGTTVALGIANQLSEGWVAKAARFVEYKIDPPYVLASVSEPLEITKDGIWLRNTGSDADFYKAEYREENKRIFNIKAFPGSYLIAFRRNWNGNQEQAQKILRFEKSGEEVGFSLVSTDWVGLKDLAEAGDEGGASIPTPLEPSPAAPPSPGALSRTRWTATPSDFATLAFIGDRAARSILAIALAEVGTSERGRPDERMRIIEYWSAIPSVHAPTIELPWASVFINWVVAKADVSSPQSPRSEAWRQWGTEVSFSDARPGMIAIYQRRGGGTQPQRYMVGIILRKRDGCTDVIAGNVVDRVVITCVSGVPLDVRWPVAQRPAMSPAE
ncbi:hypothetical protein AB4Z01_30650 [Inquilinus sp. YAF38]|uniref:hypothetical protein n=1 Tax=Inquilinus sp. YAF38 TaxID=3233084 RepID=UPI003F93AFF0